MKICDSKDEELNKARTQETRKQGHEAKDQQAAACDEEVWSSCSTWCLSKPTRVEIEKVIRRESEVTHRTGGTEV